MDYNMGLTQALSDGTNTYLYGNGRIAQVNTTTDYFLPDALGSVRQLTSPTGDITYARAYDPYGVVTSTAGAAQTSYGYTGEFTSNEMVYLRARYYAPGMGRFLTRDTWDGDVNSPLSFNRWNYTNGNPINYIDPSGHISETDDITAQVIAADLRIRFNVEIVKDWGYLYTSPYQTFINDLIDENGYDIDLTCSWREGNWRNLNELEYVRSGVEKLAAKMGGPTKFKAAMKNRPVEVARVKTLLHDFELKTGLALPSIPFYFMVDGLMLPDGAFNSGELFATYTTIHELGHVWDIRSNLQLSISMASLLHNAKPGHGDDLFQCLFDIKSRNIGLRMKCAMENWQYDPANEVAPGNPSKPYAATSITEDWAEAVAYTAYPEYGKSQSYNEIRFIRKTYVEMMIAGIY